jgi:hypothetical protein
MEAPKVIWIYNMYGSPCGWSVTDVYSPNDTRYIRADAPELVALVADLRDAMHDLSALTGDTYEISGIQRTLAAWEALTNE